MIAWERNWRWRESPGVTMAKAAGCAEEAKDGSGALKKGSL